MKYRVSFVMDEIWERAVETALDGQTDDSSVKNLTLDGAVKCVHGRLPPPAVFEKFRNLEHLSIANIGVSSLEQFPRLGNLQKLILSDNRIAGGLEFLVEAGLDCLRDLDLSNNRIQYIEDLVPLARLRIVSLDLYECPVTRVKDYRARVFGLIKSLRYLDKMDAEENERPESDDEEEEEDEEDEEEDDDPGSGEIDGDGEDRNFRVGVMENGQNGSVGVGGTDGIVDVDEDEESDADEEETETVRNCGLNHRTVESNGFRVVNANSRLDGEDEDDEDEEENYSGDEIDEEDGEDDEVVEVHEIDDSDEDDDDDGVEYNEDDEDDEEDDEEVDNEDGNLAGPDNTRRLTSTEGEIDGHEQGEDDDDDDNGETGEEEEQGFEEEVDFEDEEDGEDEEEDYGEGYLVQPVGLAEEVDGGGSDMDPGNEDDDPEGEEEVENDDNQHTQVQMKPSSSSQFKRKRDDEDDDNDDDDDDDDDGDGDEEDDIVEYKKSSRKHH